MSAISDKRIENGLAAQFAARRQALAAGGRALGWKVGFGAPAVMARLSINAPLTGYLMAENALPSGAHWSRDGWVKSVLEPEIAVHMGADLPGGASGEQVRSAIAALGPAIELADMSFAPDDVERILSGNIYQRHVVLGRPDTSRAGARTDGLRARVIVDGVETANTTDVEANTGRLLDIVRQVADTLASAGEMLRAGQIIIAGSVVPPIFVEPQHRDIRFALDPFDEIGVRL